MHSLASGQILLLRFLVRAELGDGGRVDESIGQLEADGVGTVVAHHGAAESTVVLTPGKMVKR